MKDLCLIKLDLLFLSFLQYKSMIIINSQKTYENK